MVYAAVTAKFPGTFVDADIGVYTNVEASPLKTAVLAGDVSFVVGDGTKFLANMYVRLRSINGYEVVLITNIVSNTLTVTRARDGTTAVAHPVGTAVAAVAPALFFNQVRAELQAIEDALGGTGLDEDLILEAGVALVGDQLKDSYGVVLRGKYWTGSASANYDARVYHDILSTGPTSQIRWTFAGTDRMLLTSAGEFSVDTIRPVTVGSTFKIKNQGGTSLVSLTDAGLMEVTTSIATPILQGISPNGNLSISFQGTGGIQIGAPGAVAGAVNIGVNSSNRIFFGTSTLALYGTSISIRSGAPLIFFSDDGVTEQSRITPTAGVTTWLASLATDIVINATTGGVVIGGASALDGRMIFSSPDGTDALFARNSEVFIQTNSVTRFDVDDNGVAIWGSNPLIFYSGVGTTEQSRFTPAVGSTTWAAAAGSGITISIPSGQTMSLGVGGNLNYNVSLTNNWAFTTGMNMVGGADFSLRSSGKIIFYTSADGSVEQSRFTIAVGSTTWAGAANSNILITPAGTAYLVLGSTAVPPASTARFGMSTTYLDMVAGTSTITVGVLSRLVLNSTQTQFSNNFPIFWFFGGAADERFRLDSTNIIYQIDDALVGAQLKDSPKFIWRAKHWIAGATASKDFLIYNKATGAAAPAIIDAIFQQNGFTGLTIRWRDDNVVDNNFVIPMLPDVDTTKAPAANYPGGIVRDSVNGIGSKIFSSNGAVWSERL